MGRPCYLPQNVWNLKKTVKEVKARAEKCSIDIPEEGDSLAKFMSVLRQVPKMDFFMDGLIAAFMPSGIYHMFTINILKTSQGLEDLSPELMILLSKLLRSDLEVESAQIPKELTVTVLPFSTRVNQNTSRAGHEGFDELEFIPGAFELASSRPNGREVRKYESE